MQEIYALYPRDGSSSRFLTLGKLDVVTYAPQTVKLKVVSVNSDALPSGTLQSRLSAVYQPVGVSVDAGTERFDYPGDLDGLISAGADGDTTYSDKLKALITAYRQNLSAAGSSLASDTKYIFVVAGSSGSTVTGFMPRGYRFGMVYNTGSSQKLYHDIAHELGHGTWRLRHTFDKVYGGIIEKGRADNLMDYSDSTRLAKWQWDAMASPAWYTRAFEGEEAGEINLSTNEYLGFSPNGDIINIKLLANKVNSFDPQNTNFVYSMSLDGKTGLYTWDSVSGGYKYENGLVEYPYLKNVPKDIKVAIWIHKNGSCYALYKFIPVDEGYTSDKFSDILATRINTSNYGLGWMTDKANLLDKECLAEAQTAIEKLESGECTKDYVPDNPGSIALWVNQNSPNCLETLTQSERSLMLYILISNLGGVIGDGDKYSIDDAVCRLLFSVSDEETVKWYELLKTEKDENGNTEFSAIIRKMRTNPLIAFSKWMTKAIFLKKAFSAQQINQDKSVTMFFFGTEAYPLGYDFDIWTERSTEGKIRIRQDRTYNEEGLTYVKDDETIHSFDPEEFVELHCYGDFNYGLETIIANKSTICLPALSLWALKQEKQSRDLALGIKIGAFILSLPAIAEGGTAAALATVDALFIGTDILIEDTGWQSTVTSSEGKAALTAYKALMSGYFAGRILDAAGAFDELKSSYANWKTARTTNRLASEDEAFVKIGRVAEKNATEVTGAGDVALDVANATEKQLDDIYAGLQNSPPYKYTPNTLEHKADRWAQYKIEKGTSAKDYSNWSNIYNSNMTKATKANQAADDVMATIGWGQREVTVQAGTYTRRMDIADKVAKKGVEVKSYESGKVYATQAIKSELNADKY